MTQGRHCQLLNTGVERMKASHLSVVLLGSAILGWVSLAVAQNPTVSARPASTTLPGHAYPQLDDQRRAIFRIEAPQAKRVMLDLSGRRDMNRDAEGVWTITTEPLAPGFHYYWFIIDGVPLADPASESYFGMSRMVSGLEVPSPGEDFYEAKNVPHGEVRIRSYSTGSTQQQRKVLVYTPPGYDKDPSARYPVLYLQHGYGEDRQAWWRQGRVNFILDNLLAAGKMRSMIVVMEDGGIATGLSLAGDSPPTGADRLAFAQAFEGILISETIPMIDATYRTVADASHRAIAGTSLGGYQALQIALNHPDGFSCVGGFSPALPPQANKLADDPIRWNRKTGLLFLATGSVERDANPNILRLHEKLEKAGVKHVYYESPGTAHEWLTWRRDLREFAPLLFRE